MTQVNSSGEHSVAVAVGGREGREGEREERGGWEERGEGRDRKKTEERGRSRGEHEREEGRNEWREGRKCEMIRRQRNHSLLHLSCTAHTGIC